MNAVLLAGPGTPQARAPRSSAHSHGSHTRAALAHTNGRHSARRAPFPGPPTCVLRIARAPHRLPPRVHTRGSSAGHTLPLPGARAARTPTHAQSALPALATPGPASPFPAPGSAYPQHFGPQISWGSPQHRCWVFVEMPPCRTPLPGGPRGTKRIIGLCYHQPVGSCPRSLCQPLMPLHFGRGSQSRGPGAVDLG